MKFIKLFSNKTDAETEKKSLIDNEVDGKDTAYLFSYSADTVGNLGNLAFRTNGEKVITFICGADKSKTYIVKTRACYVPISAITEVDQTKYEAIKADFENNYAKYTFKEWSLPLETTIITGNTTFEAIFTEQTKSYTVTITDPSGKTYTQSVTYGGYAKDNTGLDPWKYDYANVSRLTFTPSLSTKITQNTSIKATYNFYSETQYNFEFANDTNYSSESEYSYLEGITVYNYSQNVLPTFNPDDTDAFVFNGFTDESGNTIVLTENYLASAYENFDRTMTADGNGGGICSVDIIGTAVYTEISQNETNILSYDEEGNQINDTRVASGLKAAVEATNSTLEFYALLPFDEEAKDDDDNYTTPYRKIPFNDSLIELNEENVEEVNLNKFWTDDEAYTYRTGIFKGTYSINTETATVGDPNGSTSSLKDILNLTSISDITGDETSLPEYLLMVATLPANEEEGTEEEKYYVVINQDRPTVYRYVFNTSIGYSAASKEDSVSSINYYISGINDKPVDFIYGLVLLRQPIADDTINSMIVYTENTGSFTYVFNSSLNVFYGENAVLHAYYTEFNPDEVTMDKFSETNLCTIQTTLFNTFEPESYETGGLINSTGVYYQQE